MPSRLALFGPGDFSSWSAAVFGRISRGGPALVLSFGVVPMGHEFVPQLRQLAIDHLDAIGVPHLALEVEDRTQLDEGRNVRRLADAGFVYLQGGSPRYLADTLRSSDFLAEAERLDVPWVATSGATMASGRRYVDSTASPMVAGDGLALRGATSFAAHWDTFEDRFPGYRDAYERAAGDGLLVSLDEDTALLDDGATGEVFGSGQVHIRRADRWQSFAAGSVIPLAD